MQSLNTEPVREDMQQRIEQFAGQVVTDLAAAMAGVMTNLGHKLGLYRAMAESGPITSDELARRTATDERSVREWLNGQVAGGYVLFETNTNQYLLPPEHVFVLANPDSPAFLPPAFDVAASLWHGEDKILLLSARLPIIHGNGGPFSQRIPSAPDSNLDSVSQRCPGAVSQRWACSRPRLRARRLGHPYGAGISEIRVFRN
jgi:hypothetical protein